MLVEDVDVVGIDEAQFFDEALVDVCVELANRGIRVVVAGLDMDFKGRPFGPMPDLFAVAEDVTKVHAICMRCGDLAQYSHRKVKNDKKVLLGEMDSYEPLCRTCFIKARKIDEE
jgi:thymidine kinase